MSISAYPPALQAPLALVCGALDLLTYPLAGTALVAARASPAAPLLPLVLLAVAAAAGSCGVLMWRRSAGTVSAASAK